MVNLSNNSQSIPPPLGLPSLRSLSIDGQDDQIHGPQPTRPLIGPDLHKSPSMYSDSASPILSSTSPSTFIRPYDEKSYSSFALPSLATSPIVSPFAPHQVMHHHFSPSSSLLPKSPSVIGSQMNTSTGLPLIGDGSNRPVTIGSLLGGYHSPSMSKAVGSNSGSTGFGQSLFSIPVQTKLTGLNNNPAENAVDADSHLMERTLGYLGIDEDSRRRGRADSEQGVDSESVSVLLSGNLTASDMSNGLGESNKSEDELGEYKHQDSSVQPTRSLWIGNVDTNLNEADVRSIFSQFGEIESIRVLHEKECAFVNYRYISDAIEAKKRMQGGRVGNCIIKVGFGKTELGPSASAGSNMISSDLPLLAGAPVSHQSASRSLWVGNLSPSVKSADFLSLFEAFGSIESSRVLPNKNCGFVNFVSSSDAVRAKNEINGYLLDNLPLRIGFAKTPAADVLEDTDFVASPSRRDSPLLFNIPDTDSTFSIEECKASTYLCIILAGFEFIMEIPKLKHLQNVDLVNPSKSFHSMDPGHLRDIRRKLEHSHLPQRDFDSIFQDVYPEIIELSTDGFGNTVVQKLIERSSDQQRLKLIDKCLLQIAAIGIHKNGTWVVQKMLEYAKTTNQVQILVNALKPYIAALIMDPFGNYVVQGCLLLGPGRDQFVFDAMFIKCLEIGQGKFGARAMRACLESQHATKKQQKQIAIAVIRHAMLLITNPNGILLIHWLVDNCDLVGRFGVLVQKLLNRIIFLCNQKLSHVVILKLLSQNAEAEAREQIVDSIFEDDESLCATLSHAGSDDLAEYGALIALRCVQTERDVSKRKVMVSKLKKVPLGEQAKHQLLRKMEETYVSNLPLLSL